VIVETVTQAARAHLMFAACKLGLPERLAGGPRSSDDIAREIGAHRNLYRLMRGLVACGVLEQGEDGRFALTEDGNALRADAANSMRTLVMEWGEVIAPAMAALAHGAITGETPFDHVFGMSVWDYRARHPAIGQAFHAAAAAQTAQIAHRLLATYDFTGIRHVVDVGGGHGALLGGLLQANAGMTGVVFDRSVDGTAAYLAGTGVADRIQVVAGDFFAFVPGGGDLYLLKAIIHDWDDTAALRLLVNCHDAMASGARILLLERLMPERATLGDRTVLSDILMMAIEHGRERTEAELKALLAEAGFREIRVLPHAAGHAGLIEARR
jgi:SAM-dependent methyltransferase